MDSATINLAMRRLNQAIRQDPKKSGVLAILGAAFLLLVARAALSGGPAHAAASSLPANRTVAGANSSRNSQSNSESTVKGSGNALIQPVALGFSGIANHKLHEWLSQPVPAVSRNLFAVKLEYFPRDGKGGTHSDKNDAENDEGDFWGRLEKSLLLQADQKEKRDNIQANYKLEAGKLRLDSIMMGPSPKAMIDGHLVSAGESVSSFRVTLIEARRIIVERDGCRFEITMK